MRIVHTCLRYPPATGGVETYVKEIVERTRDIAAQRDVRVVTSKMRTHGPISTLAPKLLLNDPPYVQRLHHLATPLISYPRLQALRYYLGHHQPDIIHGYSFWYQPADAAARYAKKHHVPFIFHPMYYENDTRRKSVWQLYKKLYGSATFKAAAVVVVISPQERALIEKAGFSVKRFELIPPGINTEKFSVERPNPFVARGLTGKIIITVGRLAASKGLDDLLAVMPRVIRQHPDIQYVMIGEDFGALESLKFRVKQLGIAARVHFWGKVSDDILWAAYQHADILVHPSQYEAFGIVPAEALAAGTVVIARNVSALPYVVPNQKAGLLFRSIEELEKHILTLLNNANQRRELGQFGKSYVQQSFSWEQSIKKVLSMYSEFAPNVSLKAASHD